MAKAKKLPSGQWRTLVYSHTEYIDGKPKRRYESFTASTKADAEFMAAQFARQKQVGTAPTSALTVGQAIDSYIASKTNILSPTTIREYKNIRKNSFQSLMDIQLSRLNQAKIQQAVNTEAIAHSPKTVKNAHGLLSAALALYRPEFVLRTTLPKQQKAELTVPDDNYTCLIMQAVHGTELYIPVLLAATCSLRRSEICGLIWKDIDFNSGVLSVRRAMVLKDGDGKEKREWVIKPPKTFKSARKIIMPSSLVEILKVERGRHSLSDFVVDVAPSTITNQFIRILKRNNLPPFRFHDLRHYSASVMLAENIPDKYAMERGGWSSLSTMKDRYQHTFSDERLKNEAIINEHFNSIMQHEMQHEIKKPLISQGFQTADNRT